MDIKKIAKKCAGDIYRKEENTWKNLTTDSQCEGHSRWQRCRVLTRYHISDHMGSLKYGPTSPSRFTRLLTTCCCCHSTCRTHTLRSRSCTPEVKVIHGRPRRIPNAARRLWLGVCYTRKRHMIRVFRGRGISASDADFTLIWRGIFATNMYIMLTIKQVQTSYDRRAPTNWFSIIGLIYNNYS